MNRSIFPLFIFMILFTGTLANGCTEGNGHIYDVEVYNIGFAGSIGGMLIDSTDRFHLSYRDDTNHQVIYSTDLAGAWTETLIDSDAPYFNTPSLAIDSLDNLHLAYFNKGIEYATNQSGTWVSISIDPVDPNLGDYEDNYITLLIDAGDQVHLGYTKAFSQGGSLINEVKYATNKSGVFKMSNIASNSYVNSISVAASGEVHLSYSNFRGFYIDSVK